MTATSTVERERSSTTPPPASPPRWKIAVLAFVGLYPLVTVASVVASRVAPGLPLLARTALMVAAIVPTMAYVVTPLLQRGFRAWLRRSQG